MKKHLLSFILVLMMAVSFLSVMSPRTVYAANETYTVKFAMPTEYIGYGIIIKLYQNGISTRMTDTKNNITIDGKVYRIYSKTTDTKPDKNNTYFYVYLNVPTTDDVKDTTWYSDGEWQCGENIIAVPVDYTKMLEDEYQGRVTFTSTSTYTVTFNVQGHGIAPQSQTVKSGGKVSQPDDPTEAGWAFGGWYTEPSCTTKWNFESNTVTKDTTLYAKWTEVTVPTAADFTFTAPASLTYDGTAKEASVTGKEGMGAITVKYFDKDGEQLSSAPVDAGTYTVKIDVAEGTAYKSASNLTASGWTFTIARADVTVTAKNTSKEYGAADPAFEAEVSGTVGTDTVEYTVSRAAGEDAGVYTIIPTGKDTQGNYSVSYVSGTFTINPAQGSDVKTDTEALTKIQNNYKKEYNSENVSVGMQISDEKVDEDDMALIKAKAGSKKLNGINIELVVTVDGKAVENAGSENNELISTEFKFDLSGKTDIQVLRVHEEELDELTETPNTDGECIVLDKEAGSITIKAKKYSTYAVAYNEGETPEYAVTFDSMGGTAVAGQHHAKGEKLVKPTDPTKSGYTFAGWYMDKNYNQAWNFNLYTVSGPTTLYAKWTAAGAGGSSTPNTADGNTAWPYVMAGLAAAAAIAFAAARKRRMQ